MTDWLRGGSLAATAFGVPFFFRCRFEVASIAFLFGLACHWLAIGANDEQ